MSPDTTTAPPADSFADALKGFRLVIYWDLEASVAHFVFHNG